MSLKLIAVGDISLGDFPFCPGFGIRSALSQGLSPFDEVVPILKEGDLVFGNLETVISDYNLNPQDLKSWEMRGREQDISILKNAGFNLLNIANNHTMQHGIEIFDQTVAGLHKEDMDVVGLVTDDGAHCQPVVRSCKGYQIGFLGYAFEGDNYKNDKVGYAFGPDCFIKEDIEALKKRADIVVVSCHWGVEFIKKPSSHTVMLARKLVDWGADIILGHHPHVLQGTEYYKDGVILYSMGNFLFDMLWDGRFRDSAVFIFDIDVGKIHLNTVPVYISDDYSLTVPKGADKQVIDDDIKRSAQILPSVLEGDLERKTLRYYIEYEALRKSNRYKSYKYFLKNIRRIDRCFLFQIITRTFGRRINDIIGFMK